MRARTVFATTGLIAAALLTSTGFAMAHGGANADGKAEHSPGIVSGNLVQAPVHVPVNATGNTLNVVGLLNPDFGNESSNS
ncbi:chaplin [Streptomyces sp. IMTB 2501]|uniref:chaplin n=1 Tax=Streptomyces sp. IMTB 2501 TaxID=1776340 RepID=UPI00096D0C49|nr:chaplin [Streptomyces sp. IMTB 2501]OLZ66026.1 chaplin [Streptomyces sp. IMTB 2501]